MTDVLKYTLEGTTMKKLIALCLAVAMCIGLSGCCCYCIPCAEGFMEGFVEGYNEAYYGDGYYYYS